MTDEWLDTRPHLHSLATKMRELLTLADEWVCRGRASGASVDYGAFEEQVAAAAAGLESAIHEAALSSLDVDVPFIRVWGKSYRRVHRIERTYGAMSGPVTVTRTLYRELGKRSGRTLDPIALRAGVVDGSWLPRTARAMSHLLAQGTSREASTTCTELLRLPYSRSSFERVGHAVGAEYLKRREQVEPRLIEAFVVPEDARSISVSLDRTSVPMEEPRQAPRRAKNDVSEDERKLIAQARAIPGRTVKLNARTKAVLRPPEATETSSKIERNYRMAYCATVTLHDARGEAIHTIRYGRMPATPGSAEAMLHRDVQRLMERLRDDVRALRAQRSDLTVVLLADGAPELWNLFASQLNASTIGTRPVELVDAWHALEYVASAAQLAESCGKAATGSYRVWKSWLLTEPGGAQRVIERLKATRLRDTRGDAGTRPVGDAIRYLTERVARMDYAGARAAGLPIGSGAVEATCKSLVTLRMKRPGSRWKPTTGNEVLQLRALQLSDRWAPAMAHILEPLRKPVHVISRAEALGRAA